MPNFSSATDRDYVRFNTASITFTGAAGLGAVGTASLFTVTGEVMLIYVVPFCTTLLGSAGAPTISLGVTGDVDLLIPATTALNIDTDEFWFSTTPTANGALLPASLQSESITDNILADILVASITRGTIRVDVYWLPLSSNGLVVAA